MSKEIEPGHDLPAFSQCARVTTVHRHGDSRDVVTGRAR